MFYTFRQNNSGGSCDINDEVDVYVVIEANSAHDANSIATDNGIYFDGCYRNRDCSCCGNRWSRADDCDATETPEIYGEPASESTGVIIYYLDGRVERFSEK